MMTNILFVANLKAKVKELLNFVDIGYADMKYSSRLGDIDRAVISFCLYVDLKLTKGNLTGDVLKLLLDLHSCYGLQAVNI